MILFRIHNLKYQRSGILFSSCILSLRVIEFLINLWYGIDWSVVLIQILNINARSVPCPLCSTGYNELYLIPLLYLSISRKIYNNFFKWICTITHNKNIGEFRAKFYFHFCDQGNFGKLYNSAVLKFSMLWILGFKFCSVYIGYRAQASRLTILHTNI